MDTNELARLSPEERQPYFNQTAGQIGLDLPLIEKDFWVSWLLGLLFKLDEFGPHLTFKGGTSLSKAFGLIERFSEDIDLSIEREYLGFDGVNSPEAEGISNKERGRRIRALNAACEGACGGPLLAALRAAIDEELGPQRLATLKLDPANAQTILWEYPRVAASGTHAYVAPVVKMEFGARSDHFPVERVSIRALVVDALDGAVIASPTPVRVLRAIRTFWEKATILHQVANLPDDKDPRPRMSRHYYDLDCMARSDIRLEALGDLELLARVATHKSVFFSDNKARYDLACPPTLRLVPPPHVQSVLSRDFVEMRSMFFNPPAKFEEILESLGALEKEINLLGDD